MNDERGRGGAEESDRLEIPEHVEGEIGVEAGVDQERGARDEQRVPVRRLFRDMRRGEVAVRAGPVLDDKAIRKRPAQAIRDQPRQNVGLAAGGSRDDDRHQACRVVLSDCPGAREQDQAGCECDAVEDARHGLPRRCEPAASRSEREPSCFEMMALALSLSTVRAQEPKRVQAIGAPAHGFAPRLVPFRAARD
jgi:hypothetical protein